MISEQYELQIKNLHNRYLTESKKYQYRLNQCDFIEDMTKDKQMQTLGLNHKYLPFALNRDYSLPLIFNGSQKRIREFSLFLKSLGLKLHEGGRVFNICDDCSKGFAMKSVVKKLRTELKSNPYTIVVGDSPNDISMLKQSDQPCIIPLPNKDNLIDLEIKNIIMGVFDFNWKIIFIHIQSNT